jgi:hypothetical protein
MTLGSTIQSIEFSAEEKLRITRSLNEGAGVPYELVSIHAPSIRNPDIWASAHKRFRAHGFKVGSQRAREFILKAVFQTAKLRPEATNTELWSFYRNIVLDYVITKLPKLNELLLHESVLTAPGGLTKSIFDSIRRKMPLYDVTTEEPKRLYEMWGFDRISDFDEMFSHVPVEIDVFKQLLGSAREDLRRDLKGELISATDDLGVTIAENVDRLDALAARLKVVEDQAKLIPFRRRDDLSATTHNTRALEASKRTGDNNYGARRDDVKHLDPETVLRLQSQIENLEKLVSVSLKPSATIEEKATTVNNSQTAEQAVSSWVKRCTNAGLVYPSRDPFISFLQLLKTSRIYLAEAPLVLESFFASVQGVQIRRVTCSPLWTSSADWAESLAFISEPRDSARVLYFADFDVGLQEAYLIPGLVQWLDTQPPASRNRVVLCPSASTLTSVSRRVMELAMILPRDLMLGGQFNFSVRDLDKWSRRFASAPASSLMKIADAPKIDEDEQVVRVGQASGTMFPLRLRSRFVSAYQGLREVLDPSPASELAARVTLLPWVKATHGDSVASLLTENLRFAFSGA